MTFTPQDIQQHSQTSEVAKIPLLEEELQVVRRKRKVGEVILRKQVETHMIQIPVRREKLIVEKTGENPELITEIAIAEEQINGFNYQQLSNTDSLHITKSLFLDIATAQDLLQALAHLSSADNTKIRVEIVTNCSENQIEHQSLCDRYI